MAMIRRAWLYAAICVVFGIGILLPSAQADSITDFNLYVCQSCSSPPSAPTLLTNLSAFDVGDGGNHATVSPLLIIVGVYNGGAAPTVSYGTSTYSPGGTAIYGWNGSSTAVTFNASSGDAYSALGIAPEGGGSSELFSNWNLDLTGNGLAAATSFSLYVYELSGVLLPANGTITLNLEGSAPIGSFVLGYACEKAVSTCPSGKEGATPNTTTGIVDGPPVPEPSTLTMLGTGLLALGSLFRRRLCRQP